MKRSIKLFLLKLKGALAVTYASERDKYTSAKDALVQTLLREAQAWKSSE
jgi:hypothetical protein